MNKFEKVSFLQFSQDIEAGADYITTGDSMVWDDDLRDYRSLAEVYADIKLPTRQTGLSAGYDFSLPLSVAVFSGQTADIPTGIKVRLDDDCVLLLDIRSSMAIKRGLTIANTIGVIDADYHNNPTNEGHIHICVRNNSDETVVLSAGMRIAQGIIVRYETTVDDEAHGVRDGGIGSTGDE